MQLVFLLRDLTIIMKRLFYAVIFLLGLIVMVSCEKEEQLPYVEDVCSVIANDDFKEYCYRNFDFNHDMKVSMEEAAEVTYIGLLGYRIQALNGLEYFPNLEELDCRQCQSTVLDVSSNKKLKTLKCSNNQLKSLDVSNNPLLELLECGINQLTSLDVSNNTRLTGLECRSNQLTSLNVSSLSMLRYLSCGNNQLKSIDLAQNTQLHTISCRGNMIDTMDLSMTQWILGDQSMDLGELEPKQGRAKVFVNQAQKNKLDDYLSHSAIVYRLDFFLKN